MGVNKFGKAPESFFEAEEMEGFFVSENRKKLWAILIDLYQELSEVLERYDIPYFVLGGGLLGAVRHKGFIPWDDDLDIVIPWEGYKTLLKIGPQEFSNPYYFQSCLSSECDLEFASFSRLRRSDTTGYTQWEHDHIFDKRYNKGVFIDIFPLFYVPSSNRFLRRQEILHYKDVAHGHLVLSQKRRGLIERDEKYEEFVPLYEAFEGLVSVADIKKRYLELSADSSGETEEVGLTSFRTYNEKLIWDSDWFKSAVALPFEYAEIKAPVGYEEILTRQYGDWHVFDKGTAYHTIFAFNPDVPYTQFNSSEFSSDY